MCPVCMTTAALIAGSVAATGGLAAFALKGFGANTATDMHCTASPPKQASASPVQPK